MQVLRFIALRFRVFRVQGLGLKIGVQDPSN